MYIFVSSYVFGEKKAMSEIPFVIVIMLVFFVLIVVIVDRQRESPDCGFILYQHYSIIYLLHLFV